MAGIRFKNKIVWNDGDIIAVPVETPECIANSEKLWCGGDRVEIFAREKQSIFGFGGAFTESAAYNYSRLSPGEKQKALELLFGDGGLNYNFCRICIGSSDFALESYSYTLPGDTSLSSFSIEHEKKTVIPFIKDALAYSKQGIFLFASPWSPPAYMKDNGSLIGGKLREDCYELWASYICRFVEEFAKEGIPISAITPQNEPVTMPWDSCSFSPDDQIRLIRCLNDQIRRRGLDLKILTYDFNRGGMFEYVSPIYDKIGDMVWGSAFHWYNGSHIGELRVTHDCYPDKVLVESEFCQGIGARLYNRYRVEMMDVLDNSTNAVTEWNLLLDTDGGPYHARERGCNSPIYRKEDRVFKRSVYSQMYLFSHYIRRGGQGALHIKRKKRTDDACPQKPRRRHIVLYLQRQSV